MIHVVAGILFDANGHFLLARRPMGKVYEGFWEFPGGKVEENERASDALIRELKEELGIVPKAFHPWITKTFRYTHADVNIEFFKVTHWSGEVRSLEDQDLHWQGPGSIRVTPVLGPNITILKSLRLPDYYLITNLSELGEANFFQLLLQAVQKSPQLIQVREKSLSSADLEAFTKEVLSVCRPSGSKVLVNTHFDIADRVGADGVHLNSEQLKSITYRPQFALCAASCHSKEDLVRVDALGLDFAVLSPIKVTASHPHVRPIGWNLLNSLIEEVKTPIYALGGLSKEDLHNAWIHGAAGISMVRGAW
ncbi:MAG: Nudix family hydrolase [Proteobacteria bacterium]|nr:Nudix family hydrolase [Pseudomonadota bacterium]MDA1331083.1 Nudix family hydrolase [Pseudomonadota bacterium]